MCSIVFWGTPKLEGSTVSWNCRHAQTQSSIVSRAMSTLTSMSKSHRYAKKTTLNSSLPTNGDGQVMVGKQPKRNINKNHLCRISPSLPGSWCYCVPNSSVTLAMEISGVYSALVCFPMHNVGFQTCHVGWPEPIPFSKSFLNFDGHESWGLLLRCVALANLFPRLMGALWPFPKAKRWNRIWSWTSTDGDWQGQELTGMLVSGSNNALLEGDRLWPPNIQCHPFAPHHSIGCVRVWNPLAVTRERINKLHI